MYVEEHEGNRIRWWRFYVTSKRFPVGTGNRNTFLALFSDRTPDPLFDEEDPFFPLPLNWCWICI